MNYKLLEQKIITSYTEGITVSEAERLAGEFLGAQIKISEEVSKLSLMARLLKSSVKEERGKLLYKEATTPDKKPSDSVLQALVDSNAEVLARQDEFDKAEESANEMLRLFGIFKDAHLHFRAISKGRFE